MRLGCAADKIGRICGVILGAGAVIGAAAPQAEAEDLKIRSPVRGRRLEQRVRAARGPLLAWVCTALLMAAVCWDLRLPLIPVTAFAMIPRPSKDFFS